MMYKESEGRCDWCNGEIDDGEDVACRSCYERLEKENARTQGELGVALARIDELEGMLQEALHEAQNREQP